MTTEEFFDLKYAIANICPGAGRDTLIAAIKSGRLSAKRSGKNEDGDPTGKYLVTRAALNAYFGQLEDA